MARHFNNIMELYIIENYKEYFPDLKGRMLTDELIKECLDDYGVQTSQVLRTEKGKPYIEDNIHLSVSHSGTYFVCVISELPVGIDIQEKRKSNIYKIAERYFTDKEREHIEEYGEEGFFMLWCRKEAYSKFTGNGIAEMMKGTDVLERDDVDFTDFLLEDGVYCSYCIKK